MKKKGTVKWFNQKKGFGFILGEDGRDYFVHFSGILKEGFKTLEQDQVVTFDVSTNDKGEIAVNVECV